MFLESGQRRRGIDGCLYAKGLRERGTDATGYRRRGIDLGWLLAQPCRDERERPASKATLVGMTNHANTTVAEPTGHLL